MEYLTVQDLVDQEKGPVWVVNRSSEIYEHTADLFITFTQQDLRKVETVPATWLPVCLTERFTRKVVLESSYFTEAVAKGLIGIVTAEQAAAILKRSGAEAEKARMKAQVDAVRAAAQSRSIANNVTVTNPNEVDVEVSSENRIPRPNVRTIDSKAMRNRVVSVSEEEADEEVEVETTDDVSPRFQAWVLKLNQTSDEQDAVNLVKTRSQFSEEEARFLAKNCKHPRIKKMAQKAIG